MEEMDLSWRGHEKFWVFSSNCTNQKSQNGVDMRRISDMVLVWETHLVYVRLTRLREQKELGTLSNNLETFLADAIKEVN